LITLIFRSVIDLISKNSDSLKSTKVREIMDDAYPSVPPSAYVETVSELMKHYRAVLVEKNGKSIGIVTKADLLKAV
jgi:predicted transcriptional regulator